jgi:hypothetical protein
MRYETAQDMDNTDKKKLGVIGNFTGELPGK